MHTTISYGCWAFSLIGQARQARSGTCGHNHYIMEFFENTFPYIALAIIGGLIIYAIFSKGSKDKKF